MKLKISFFDFEKCEIGFNVPKEIMWHERFGNVPNGVDVDLGAITGNAALGIKELAATDSQQPKVKTLKPICKGMPHGSCKGEQECDPDKACFEPA